jgi:uncharacterized protein with GYD domain
MTHLNITPCQGPAPQTTGHLYRRRENSRTLYLAALTATRAAYTRRRLFLRLQEGPMPTFMLSLNWTDQGIRSVKDFPKRSQAARDLGKKVGVEIKQIYLTSGDSDLVVFVDTPNGDNVAKFALAIGALGNVRTRTARAWPESEFQKLVAELP